MIGHERRPMTYVQVAEAARRSERQVRRWVAAGLLTAHDIQDGRGGSLRIIWSDDVDAFLGRATRAELDTTDADRPDADMVDHDASGHDGSGYVEKRPVMSREVMGVPDRIRLADVAQQLDALSQAVRVLPAVATAVEALTQRINALVIAQETGQGSEPAGQPELRAAVDALTTQVQALNDAQAAAVRAQAIPADAIPDQRTGLLRRLLGLRTKDVGDHAEGRTLGE